MSKLLNEEQGYNSFYTIDDLPFTTDQKEMVLEWFAQKIWNGLDEPDHYKSYDPLIISGKTALSYVFNLRDGGRHHSFDSLKELEEMLVEEMQKEAYYFIRDNEDFKKKMEKGDF